MDEHLYIVTYDIGDQKRWRAVFRLMNGYGEWVQLSVFQCRLSRKRHAEMLATLDEIVSAKEDHVVVIDVGVAENVTPRVVSLGKRSFEPVQREPVIV
jgi:CRISPR-associated protein Cas2